VTTYARGAKVKDGIGLSTTDCIPELSGVLLPNQKRFSVEPEYFGSIRIEGYEWRLRGWNRIGRDGKPYIKLRCLRRDP